MSDPKPWFAPKTHGYGAGAPLAWQGWALLLGFLVVAFAAPLLLGGWGVLIVLPACAVLAVIARRKTAGEWRWRWNGQPK